MPKEMLEHIFNVLAPLGWETRAVDKSFFQSLDLVFLLDQGLPVHVNVIWNGFRSSELAISFRPKLSSIEFDHSQFQHTPKLPPFPNLQLFSTHFQDLPLSHDVHHDPIQQTSYRR
jgi:hypothetical protein